MPGAKHFSLNVLSPSNCGSVRRKRSQRLPDPSDPSLDVEAGTGSPIPASRARRLVGKTSAPLPRPVPSAGTGCSLPPLLVSFQMDEGAHLCPQQGRVSLFSEPNRESGDLLSIKQVGKESGHQRTCWNVLCHQELSSCPSFICRLQALIIFYRFVNLYMNIIAKAFKFSLI